jgi:cytoskeletal protein CcmA (bactofilin family)
MTEVHNDAVEEEDFDTTLSEDVDFSGTLVFEKPFLIRGRLSGEIDSQGLLVIDEGAVVEADINASTVVIRGLVKGDITATGKVELSAAARLTGNITAPEVSMESGCVFNGRCVMQERSDAE